MNCSSANPLPRGSENGGQGWLCRDRKPCQKLGRTNVHHIERTFVRQRERELDTGQPTPAAYGRYENVLLTQSELDGLKADLPDKWNYYIDRLSCHIASSGKRYHSHAATIYKWAQEDAAKKAPKMGIPDYSCKEGESL